MLRDNGRTGTPDPDQSSKKPEPAPAGVTAAARPVSAPSDLRAGARLRAAREALGLSVEQASQRLRIRSDFLAALEAMNLNLLPGKAYAKAYLRSYAEMLGIPAADMVAQFERESALLREDVEPQIYSPESKPRPERPWFAAALMAVVGIGFVGWHTLNRQQTPSSPPPAPATTAAPVIIAPEAAAPVTDDAALTNATVAIRAVAPSWLEVRGPDGTIFLSRTLQAGEVYEPDSGAGWTLHARDGSAFEVSVNGSVVGFLGEKDAPVLGRRVDGFIAASQAPQG